MNLGAAAFWIFVAVIVVAVIWKKKNSEAMRHETVRFLIEKNQKLDESQLAKLLNPDPPDWMKYQSYRGKVGDGYRTLRIIGVILMFIAVGILAAAFWRGMMLGLGDRSVLGMVTGVPMLAMIGAGLFIASRFLPHPPSDNIRDKQDL